MLVEITIFNKKQRPQYSFLVDLNPTASSAQELMNCREEDLEDIIDKELSYHDKGYYGAARDFNTDEVLLISPFPAPLPLNQEDIAIGKELLKNLT